MDADLLGLIARISNAQDLAEAAAIIVEACRGRPGVEAAFVVRGGSAAALTLRWVSGLAIEPSPKLLMRVEHTLREWLAGVRAPPDDMTGYPPPHAVGVKGEGGSPPLHVYPTGGHEHEALTALCIVPSAHVAIANRDHALLLAGRDLLRLAERLKPVAHPAVEVTSEGPGRFRREELLTRSALLDKIFKKLDRVADIDVPVLIMGETGTGKELIARALHRSSPRRKRRFYAQNCGAISEGLLESELFGYMKGAFTGADRDKKGLFEVASGSTLFLDEIGEMDIEMQKKLLRVLQEREVMPIGSSEPAKVDVRIICATNRNLKDEVAAGRFREDLYYRLQVIQVTLPPLRERKEDIPLLIDHFLDKVAARRASKRKVLDRRDPRVLEVFLNFDWPGNIRELENAITRLAHFAGDVITFEVLAEDHQLMREVQRQDIALRPVAALDDVLDALERREIENALRHTGGNRSQAADLLRVHRRSLLRRLKKYGL